MKKPEFKHSAALFNASWILSIPILIDICTACTLFSYWIVWCFFSGVAIISIIRLVHGIKQKCYKFSIGLCLQLLAGATILLFFQLSFNNVIHTPFSHPVKEDVIEVENPMLKRDSISDGVFSPASHKLRGDSSTGKNGSVVKLGEND